MTTHDHDVFWVIITDAHSGQEFVGEVEYNTEADQWSETSSIDVAAPYNWGNQYASHLDPDNVVRIMKKFYGNGYEISRPYYNRPNKTVDEAVRFFGHTGSARGPLIAPKKSSQGGSDAEQVERQRLAQFAREQRQHANGGIEYDRDYRANPTSRAVKRSMVSDVDERTGESRVLGILDKLSQFLKSEGARISEITAITPSHYKFRIRTDNNSGNHAGIIEVFKKFQNVIEKGGGSLILDPKLTRGAIKLIGIPSFSRSVDQSIR